MHARLRLRDGPLRGGRCSLPTPTLSHLSPATGNTNTVVTLTGTGFSPGMTVRFKVGANTVAAAWVLWVNPTTLKAPAPALAANAVADVSVVNPTNAASNVLAGAWTHLSRPQLTINTTMTVDEGNTAFEGRDVLIELMSREDHATSAGPHELSSLRVNGSAVVTHPARDARGLQLIVGGTLEVLGTAKLDATAMGLRGGYRDANTSPNGETLSGPNVTTTGGATEVFRRRLRGAGRRLAGDVERGVRHGGAAEVSGVGRGEHVVGPAWAATAAGASISPPSSFIVSGQIPRGRWGGGGRGRRRLRRGDPAGGDGRLSHRHDGGRPAGAGGAAASTSGPGGGGRIAVQGYAANAYQGSFLAAPGAGSTAAPGGAGTILLKGAAQERGDVMTQMAAGR